MLSHQSILTLGIALIVAFLAATPGLAQSPPSEPPPPAFVPGEIIVKFQPNVGRLGAQNSLRAEGLRLLALSPNEELLRVQVAPGREAEVIAKLQARGDVAYATYNYQIQALGDPNDTYYSSQWALKQAQDHDIDAPEAWDIHTGNSSVIIAMIDTGVDLDHPDLAAKITSGSEAGYNYIFPGLPPNDDNGHGTHVAGIAAALSNNDQGIAGVSWGARIMPIKVLSASGAGSIADLSAAIRYAADHGARVINMSLGGGCGFGWPNVEEAVNYAL
ncbi:MAG TPA: S8 family serine peptidase, partial [Anaerolineae bacterium]|nr:S8 family serine peptidase [Anaerolineae bacterium]